MEETDDWDNNSNRSSLTSSSSTDSDSDSVLSVILNPTQTQDDGHETFTYAAPLPVGSYALASCVYVLIDKGRSMSADMRVMWYLKRLGTIQMVDDDLDVESPEQCKIMSFIPREENLDKDGFANSIFVMDAFTRVYFLTAVYNMVYCLDMSPSNCSVDIQRCHVMLDEMTVALRRSIEGFIRPFVVPGSDNIIFEPQVYVTVIVHTPFYTSPAQQVLVQGWLINNRNFQEFIRIITTEMNRLENSLAMTRKTTRKPKHFSDENQNNNTPVGNDSTTNHHHNVINSDSNVRSTFNNNPDSGFINTLRYGMLAVRLLPQSSISNLIVITDGMITLADIQVLDSVLNQLRCISVACSFLHVSSQFHPHSGHGNVPYSELMQLIATATSGTYLNSFPKTTPNLVVNFYHDKFIMWSFKRGDGNDSSNNTTNLSCTPPRVRPGEWTVRNSNFYGNRQTQLVTKKQFSDHIQANLDNIVCCRLREGFIIEDIQFKDVGSSTVVPYMNNSSKLQLKLILPWTNHIYIEYDITVKWPPSIKKKIEPIVIEEKPELVEPSTSTTQPPPPIQLDSLNIYYTVSVKGPYEFLHDITCTRTKKSQLLSKIPRHCQFHLSSCRSSSISVATATTTITRNLNLLPDRSYSSIEKKVTSKYRQALITRFWSTMHSIAQTDLLIKHLEAYSSSTGHLSNSDYCNQPIEQNESQDQQLQKLENQQIVEIEPTSPMVQNLQVLETPQILQLDDSSVIPSNLNSSNSKTDTVFSTEKTETNLLSFLTSEIPNKSPLHNGVPLFYYLVTNSNTSFCLKQNQFKTDDQQQSYTDQQHQRFVDFWKPVCTLDPDTQWPKWFSTYRIGGGVLLLRHDRSLPQWFHKENIDNDDYQTLTCNKSSLALYALLKQWCTFVLIDEHSYVKCLDQSETYTDDVSFCIARVSPRPPSCCCVVLHLAFQSCVPASVHHKIMDDLKKNIELLDSTTALKQSSFEDNNQVSEDQENYKKKVPTITIEESLIPNKPSKHQRYVYLMDKPLEKFLIRYERIPSEFTTVIFPDGSQPSSAITTINIQNPRSKLNIGLPRDTVHESSTGVESKPVSTTTTLSRYLYHKRWIWSSGCSRYSQCSNSVSQKLQLQLQLARTLSVLTRIRLREGFKFAHSSAGIINMVLEVDMIEGSPHCPSTPTSHCVIQYVLFPPNKLQKQQPKPYEYNSVFDKLNMENKDDESSSIMSAEEQQKLDKLQKQGRHIVSFAGDSNDCCSKHKMEDEYQLITECWIEPQHGTVVVNEKQNYNYMSGLMYEQLADALWQVDSDCIGSLFTFQHMQHMCMDQNILVSNPDIDLNRKRRQSKTVIIDAGRIYKLPFTFNLVNLLPKCRHHSSMTFSLFTADHNDTTELNSAKDERKLNYILERSFYSRLRTYNNRSFDVNDSDISLDMNQTLNDQEIGQCFIKRVNDTRLILTVGPSLIEEKCNIAADNLSEDNLQPFGRSRANTWHYTKRGTGQSLLNTQSQENSIHYYRTMSVGSKPYYKDSEDLSWAQLRVEQNFSTAEIKHNSYSSDNDTNGQNYPTHMFIDVYDCRQEDVENVLMSDCSSFDHSLTDDYSEENSSCDSTETNSDEEVEEKNIISNREQNIYDDPPVDPMFLEKYLYKIRVIYDRSLVTTVFQALHLGLNVRSMDIQRAVDRCQHRLISFDITDYIKVVCDHFKKNANSCCICPADNTTLKSHHDMIHSKFSATLDRHMLKPVVNHQDYYFYDLIDDFDCDEYSNSNRRQKYLTNILLGETYHKTDFDTHELDEQDIFPLFVHLVCTIKTNTVTKSQSVRSLPTCILELVSQDNDDETSKNIDFSNIKVSLDVYCLMLPINVYDDDDDDDDEIDKYTTMNSSEQLHFPINNKSTTVQPLKQTDDHENSFVYLSSSLPPRHAQGLAAFLAEVEWCMRDEMAAGLLQYPTVTTNSLEKIIEHVSNSPQSPSNDHQQIPVHFVVPSSRPSKYNSVSLFLQKLDQFDIILENDNGNEHYALEQSTKDTFYVVEKYLHPSPDSTVFENNSDLENSPGSDDFLSETDHSKPILPNFWIILKIQPDQQCQKEHKSDNNNTVNTLVVNVYFHCRFSESNVQGKYSAIMEIVKQNVHQAATVVNQSILLCRLYETKTCDPLLEPIIEDHDHSDDGDENGIGERKKTINYFTFGQFKCPVVWSTRFSLHPRLQRATAMGLLGIQVLHTMLEGFSVRNRRNMFVYKESSGSVFYLRIYENSSQQQQDQKHNNNLVYPLQYDSDDDDTISRCSSATSTTITSTIFSSNQSNFSRKYSEDVNYMDNKSIQNPGTRSLGGYWGDIDSKDVEDLTLKVHGISPVGDEIRIDLVRVLQNRLNDGVLELLTTMLYRNPLCRLYPDDVRFVQPSNGHPDYTMKLSLPIETKITKLFIHNLKRNAATLLLFPPKYASRHHRFNYAYSMINETKKPIIRSFFMYNQPIAGTSVIGGKRITSGKRGLACVLFDIYSNEDHDSIDDLYDYPTDPDLFERHTHAECIDDLKSTTEYSGYIKLFVWWRGRDNMEVLQQKLTSTVTYSLWDIYIERFLWEQPLIIEQPSEIYVNPLCIQFLAKWIAFGARKSVPLAYHSKILCRIHISHVLREFKTHLSWSWLSSSNNLPISVRYFYVPRTKYGGTSVDCVSNNIISDSADPLQLRKEHDSSLNNLMFYEWKVPDTDSVVCPPSAACILIVVSVTSTKSKHKRKRQQHLNMGNEHSDSDADNGLVVPENNENINIVGDNIETSITDDQPITLNNDGDENVIQNTVDTNKSDTNKYQKPQKVNTCEKISKLFLLAVSGQSVHALSYSCHKNEDQPIAIQCLSRWLEWRNIVFTSSIYHMIGLRNSKIYRQFGSTQIKSQSSKINNNLDLLLDYKNYAAVVGEHVSHEKIFVEKNFRINNRGSKPLDNDTEDKKNKPLNYKKDVLDSYIERLVRNSKQKRRTEMYQKLLYDMWTQVDAVVTKEAFRTFYQHSRLIHYCLTPLLFLPWWRLESAATRDHLVDASKLKSLVFTPAPQWHKRLCARLTVAYAQYIETDPLFSGFQPIQIGKSRVYNDGMIMDLDCTKSITRYYKKTIPGASGGLLLIEIGVCQPFYYIKLSCIERARITNLVENYKDKCKSYCLLEQSENIIQNMHLHSFTYDFHVRTLSDRLSKLVEKQKAGKRCNYGCDILMLLDHKNSIQNSANKTGNNNKKNAIAGFLDDFLKYYTLPPLYSSCLVLAGVIKRSEIPVTGLQLYEHLVENCSEDCEGMAVLKIGDSSSAEDDDGASLFDDFEDHEFLDSQHIFGNDLTDYILVHHMAGSDIQRRQELKNNSNTRKLGMESDDFFTDNQYEVCGLFDATLVMTLSSVKQLLLDTSNEITLSYYVLLTNNENYNLKKQKTVSLKTIYNTQQRHSTPIRPPDRRFHQSNNQLLSASVPSDSVDNSLTSESATCGGSLDENNTFQNWSQLPPNHLPYFKKKCKKNNEFVYDDLNEHHQQTIKKRNLIKFYEKKAAELVAHTVDTAANRCRIHLLWKLFGIPIDQQKLGITDVTFNQLEELVNTAVFVKSLCEYDINYRHILKLLHKQPQWFTSLHKMISGQSTLLLETTSTLPPQCRIYNSNRSEHQYIVVLPNLTEFDEFDAFVIIDNGIDSTEKLVSSSDSLVNIVFRRNVSGSDEVAALVETVGDAICYLIWQTIK